MTAALLDVNVLIALLDTEHRHYDAATDWFGRNAAAGWATCPIVQNGAVRILSGSGYAASPAPAAYVTVTLAKLCARRDHQFWPDTISLLDPAHVEPTRLPGWRHLTDTYLLALARANGGRLVTFDRRLQISAVIGGERHLEVIDAAA